MKKLLALIAVFALTAPVFAAEGDPNVLITCDADGTVSYQLLDEDGSNPGLANLMRGIALDITVDGGATIDAISDYDAEDDAVPADSTQIGTGYVVYMGSIQFAADPNYVSSFGDPVAPNTDPDALGGLGTSGITVEMGSLYPEGGTAPPTSGVLFKLTVSGPCNMTIAANTTRGGCVLEDGSPANVISSGCEVGEGDCWTFDCFDCGDTNGDCAITFAGDVQTIINAWPASGFPYNKCADINKDGSITFAGDVQVLINKWPAAPKPGHQPGCLDCGPCTPIP